MFSSVLFSAVDADVTEEYGSLRSRQLASSLVRQHNSSEAGSNLSKRFLITVAIVGTREPGDTEN